MVVKNNKSEITYKEMINFDYRKYRCELDSFECEKLCESLNIPECIDDKYEFVDFVNYNKPDEFELYEKHGFNKCKTLRDLMLDSIEYGYVAMFCYLFVYKKVKYYIKDELIIQSRTENKKNKSKSIIQTSIQSDVEHNTTIENLDINKGVSNTKINLEYMDKKTQRQVRIYKILHDLRKSSKYDHKSWQFSNIRNRKIDFFYLINGKPKY